MQNSILPPDLADAFFSGLVKFACHSFKKTENYA